MNFKRALYYTNPVMTGDDIIYAQERLKSLEYYTGSIDGLFGPASEQAVISFQKTNLLEADGSLGPISWESLFSSDVISNLTYTRAFYYASPIMTGDDIVHIQRVLKFLGFYNGEVDGSFGPESKKAVVGFQKSNKLNVDGSVGPVTWNALFGTRTLDREGNLKNIKRVFIDAGHGGSDPGAGGNGLREKDITLSIASKLGKLLESKDMIINYSRKADEYVSLEDRASKANALEADLFVSVHCNSHKTANANGTECFTYPSASLDTKILSKNISKSLSKTLTLKNRGHKEANFAVLRLTNMHAILIETAFISNSSDASKLSSRQDDFVSSIASQILGGK